MATDKILLVADSPVSTGTISGIHALMGVLGMSERAPKYIGPKSGIR